MAENWVQSMNRCTGPVSCQCSIAGPHQPDNERCPRNVLAKVLESRRNANASGQDGEDAAHILAAAADRYRAIEEADAEIAARHQPEPHYLRPTQASLFDAPGGESQR